jgi:hypothetical protein
VTDARFPESLLTSTVYDGLSSDAFRVAVLGTLWAVSQRTDGRLPERALRFLHPDGRRTDCAAELVAAGIWKVNSDGWEIADFLERQTSAAQLAAAEMAREAERANATQRKRDQRAREKAVSSVTTRKDSHARRSRATSQPPTQEGRTGEDRQAGDEGEVLCVVCNEPMLVIEPDQITHPGCAA